MSKLIYEIFFSEVLWILSYRDKQRELEKERFHNYMIQKENSSVTHVFNSLNIHEFITNYTSILKDKRRDILYGILSDYNYEYIGNRNYKLSYLNFIYSLINYEEDYYYEDNNKILIGIIQKSVLYRTNKSHIFNMLIEDIDNNKMIYR